MKRKELGAWGERIAAEYLRKRGYIIRELNYRCSLGEIDIVAQDKDCLVFVEVRTRRSADFGPPEESVTFAKKEKLLSLALFYLQVHSDLPSLWRIDVVAIEVEPDGKVSRLELIPNALG
jgi:putative endonuclease